MDRSKSVRSWVAGVALLGLTALGNAQAVPAAGPLRVHPTNPRYFTDGSGKAIYLTGSHTWSQWTDAFDYNAYLNFLQSYNHNFIRLWSGDYGVGSTPNPYVRSGPGTALDGGLKADLDRLDQAFFDRIRSCVIAARDRGIYVAVVFFPLDSTKRTSDWDYSHFNVSNNVQGINGDPNGDGHGTETFDLSNPRITGYQEALARKMVDTLHDLDNVLYEIGNEGDATSIQWQYHMIRFIKTYEGGKPKQHPVGMTAVLDWLGGSGGDYDAALFNSPAEWISPSAGPYRSDPPVANGSKVIIADVDHIWPVEPQPVWIWKCFLRGLQPIHMDGYTYGDLPAWSGITAADQEAMRKYMGYTLTYARKMNLAAMTPQNSLASTAYCLAGAGEYLAYQPGSGAFSVTLAAGTYAVEWFNPSTGSASAGATFTAAAGSRSFTPPFAGEAVLYLILQPVTPPALPVVSVTAPDPNASEPGTDVGAFTVTRTGSTASALQVAYVTSGSAMDSTDYSSIGTWATIPAGATSTTIPVTPIDDTLVESSETVILTVSPSAAYTVGAPSSATVTIVDNDTSGGLPEVTSFTLMDADLDAPMAGFDPLTDGAIINLALLPTRNLNVRANPSAVPVGSVRFEYDGNPNYRIESIVPFALEADAAGDYNAWTPTLGTHTLRATPYTLAGGQGAAGIGPVITFTVIDDPGSVPPPPPTSRRNGDNANGNGSLNDTLCGATGLETLLILGWIFLWRQRSQARIPFAT